MDNLIDSFANRLTHALMIRNMKPIELSEITKPCSSTYPKEDMVENIFTLTSTGGNNYVFYDETKTNTEKMVQGGVYIVKSGTTNQSAEGNSYHFEEIIKGLNLLDGYSEYPNKRKVLKISKPI